jgi:hypothetical protein
MPTLDDVYRKFGEAAEAAQLIETELGSLLLWNRCVAEDLLENPVPGRAAEHLNKINRYTLGRLLKNVKSTQPIEAIEQVLSTALEERNRFQHSFYRQHNFRRNSEEGRTIMMEDLESIHDKLIDACKALMQLSGIDLDNESLDFLPTRHLPT